GAGERGPGRGGRARRAGAVRPAAPSGTGARARPSYRAPPGTVWNVSAAGDPKAVMKCGDFPRRRGRYVERLVRLETRRTGFADHVEVVDEGSYCLAIDEAARVVLCGDSNALVTAATRIRSFEVVRLVMRGHGEV